MKIVLHSPLQPDECRDRLEHETVRPPAWWVRFSGIGYRRYRSLEDTPVISWVYDSRFELEMREMYSRHCTWSGRLESDERHGGTIVTLKMTSAIWGTVAFLAITGLLVAVMPAGKSFVDASSGLWNMLFPPLIFGTGLIAITALNTALQKRTAKVLTGFLKRVLEASDTDR